MDQYLFLRTTRALHLINLEDQENKFKIGFDSDDARQMQDIFPPYFIVREKHGEDWYISQYSFQGNKIFSFHHQNPVRVKFLSKGVLLIMENKLLEIFDIGRSVFIWKHKFSDLIQAEDAYLNSEIIEVEGELYFGLNSQQGGNLGIICLDAQSGKIIKHFEGTFFGIFKDGDSLFSTKYENVVCKIDSRTNEVETWDVNQLLKENDFKSVNDHRCAAQDGKFCFTQTFGDHKAKLGILVFEEKTLDYTYDFEPTNGAIGSIKLTKDRIFVHTQDKTLHIFEDQNQLA